MPASNEILIRRRWPGFGKCQIKIASFTEVPPARQLGTGLARWMSRLHLASLRFTVDPRLLTGEVLAASPIVSQFLQIHREALREEWQRKISEPEKRTQERRAAPSAPAPPIPVTEQDFRKRRKLVVSAFAAALVIIATAGTIIYQRATNPMNARLALDTGQRQFALNEYSQAVLSFDHALALKPDLSETYLLRGKALLASGDRERAILDFSKLIALQPDDIRPLLERSSAYMSDRNFSASIADASKALEIDPKLARAYNMRGTAYREMGDLKRALADFNRAVELVADQDNYYQRAATYQMLGEHLQAITDLNRLLEIDPGDVPGYYARARSRRAIGDTEGAKADYTYAWALEHR
jgi:tetratricopeptide (TPR) repeat protein